MFKWLSKSGTFMQFLIFAVFTAVLWIPALIHPVKIVQTVNDGPLYTFLFEWLKEFPVLSVSLALFLVVMQAFIMFYVFQANGFFSRSNFMTAIIILLAFSWNPAFQTMHALLPALLFIIVAINSFMRLYGKQGAYREVFTTAFSIGIAALFYLPLAYLVIFVWFSLISYRVSGWREYVISIFGFVLPFLYYICWLFWADLLTNGLNIMACSLFHFARPERIPIVPTIWLSFSAFAMIVTSMTVLNVMNDKLISLRRRSWVLFNFSIVSVLALLLAGWPILSANYIFVIPLSFFMVGSLTLIKRPFWFEILLMVTFVLFILMRISFTTDLGLSFLDLVFDQSLATSSLC